MVNHALTEAKLEYSGRTNSVFSKAPAQSLVTQYMSTSKDRACLFSVPNTGEMQSLTRNRSTEKHLQ